MRRFMAALFVGLLLAGGLVAAKPVCAENTDSVDMKDMDTNEAPSSPGLQSAASPGEAPDHPMNNPSNNQLSEDNGKRIPKPVLMGLEAYEAIGREAAINEWIKGSPNEGDETASKQAISAFEKIESYYGKYRGYSLLGIDEITPTTKIVYIQINYEKGPVFSAFLCYLLEEGKWIITGRFNFNTDPKAILPDRLFHK